MVNSLASIIIPTLNEERHLPRLLESLETHRPSGVAFETIVVDNGSTDRTLDIARQHGVTVLEGQGTVANLRNIAARAARGQVLVFLDADVSVTQAWAESIKRVVAAIVRNPALISGAWYRVRPNATFIENYWFRPLERGPHTHINSGNLLVHKDTFLAMGGMDAALVTGEDYEFSARAMRQGLLLQEDSALEVIHWGYPASLREFWRREVWHGLGDCVGLASLFRSKVAMAALAFVGLLLVAGASFIGGMPRIGIAVALAAALIPVISAILKYRRFGLTPILVNSLIYAVYFSARAYAVVQAAAGRRWKSRHADLNV